MKKIIGLFFAAVFAFLSGCSSNTPTSAAQTPGDTFSTVGEAIRILGAEQFAIRVAQDYVLANAQRSESDLWTAESRIVNASPVYMDGIAGISYYECKVVSGTTDAGYVLVNVNQTDLLIPEHATEGLTRYESFQQELSRTDFRVVRYDWFRSIAITAIALENEFDGSVGGEVLSSRGFSPSSNAGLAKSPTGAGFTDRAVFRSSVLNKGCFPAYSRPVLSGYYDDMSNASASGLQKTAAVRKYYAELIYKFTDPGTAPHTPQWLQVDKEDGYAMGCGPVAWAIAYGYFRQFKGKVSLFNGADLWSYLKCTGSMGYTSPNSNYPTSITQIDKDISSVMTKCSGYVRAYPTINNMTCVDAHEMAKGIGYATEMGYSSSTSERIYNVTEDYKFDKVYSQIAADRPAILLLSTAGMGLAPDHYVVVEGCSKQQNKIISWVTTNISYLCNWGSGGTARWIAAINSPGQEYETFSAYTMNVSGGSPQATIGVYDFDNLNVPLMQWAAMLGTYSTDQKWLSGDFDHNGYDDLAKVCNDGGLTSIYVYLSNGTRFCAMQTWATRCGGFSNDQKWVSGDFDNDGYDDLANVFNDGSGMASVDVYKANGRIFEWQGWATKQGSFGTMQKWTAGDFNKDKKCDLSCTFPDIKGLASVDVHLSNGSAFGTWGRWATQKGSFGDIQKWVSGDFDNDGDFDLANVFPEVGNACIDVFASNGQNTFTPKRWASGQGSFGTSQQWLAGKFNWSLFTHVINVFPDQGYASMDIHSSNGSAFNSWGRLFTRQGFFTSDQKWIVGDFDKDGRDEIAVVSGEN